MMRLILFRHGPAGERDASRWPDDSLRPLSPRGAERTRAAARGLERIEPGVSGIVTSPLARALGTAAILEEVFEDATIERLDALSPGGSYRQVIEHAAAWGGDGPLVLVGHEPDLGKLAGVLLFGAPTPLPLKKAGACAIDFDDAPAAGKGRLRWFLTPRMLRRGAGRKSAV
jgi:phosphohistidine phosphatase